MIKVDFPLSPLLPLNRNTAGLLAQTASRFDCLLTFEKESVVLNAKSMLGLLSQSTFGDGNFTLVADGHDEKEAVEALLALIR